MYLLDTDVASILLNYQGQQPLLERRVLATPHAQLWVSVITAEEMIQGAFKLIRREQQRGCGTNGYALLAKTLRDLADFQILPYHDQADAVFKAFPAPVKRIGRGDCQIAASAITHGYTVITRNTRHFAQIPGVRFADWTA
jgi:tRNA(fMet)-specific endonuclease VapC